MKILRVKKFPLYDIFVGKGWLNWTRILFNSKNNSVKVIAGDPLRIKDRYAVQTELHKQKEENK